MPNHENSNNEKELAGGHESNWPGDWFVFHDGRVDGPFAAKEAFSFEAKSEDGKSRLVSRKGFSQWYTLKDLAEIFSITDRLDRRHGEAREKSDAAINEHLKQIQALKNSAVATDSDPLVAAVVKNEIDTGALAADYAIFPPSSTVLDSQDSIQTSSGPKRGVVETDQALESDPSAKTEIESQVAPKPAESAVVASPHASIMHEYYVCRGAVRLGKLRNPWVAGFCSTPFSAGIYWGVWYAKIAREIEYHRSERVVSKGHLGVLALFPVVHIFMIYKLAKAIRTIEEENKYKNTSPLLAAMFAIVPPFAVAYLQDCVNEHWLIHVKYSLKRKQVN